MAFGQPSGSPASPKQMQELLALLNDAGHSDFRDARGPMGFTQRQAAGKFSRDEADSLIQQMHDADHGATATEADAPVTRQAPVRLSSAEQALRRMPADQLAGELERRGWTVAPPNR